MISEERIEQLAGEVDLEHGYGDEGWVDRESARAAIRKALEEDRASRPEEGRTDTERLDWLQSHRATAYRSATGGTHWVVVDETVSDRKGILGKTLRDAIDSACGPQREGSE